MDKTIFRNDMPGMSDAERAETFAERIADAVAGFFDYGEGQRGGEWQTGYAIGHHIAKTIDGAWLLDRGDVMALRRVAMVTDMNQLNDDQLDRLVRIIGDTADGAVIDPRTANITEESPS